jgi:hypothetical protein
MESLLLLETEAAFRGRVRFPPLEPCGFFKFKRHHELIPLWEKYGDPEVATWVGYGQTFEAGGPQLTAPATKLLTKNSA